MHNAMHCTDDTNKLFKKVIGNRYIPHMLVLGEQKLGFSGHPLTECSVSEKENKNTKLKWKSKTNNHFKNYEQSSNCLLFLSLLASIKLKLSITHY